MALHAKKCDHTHEEAWGGLKRGENPHVVRNKVLKCLENCPLRIGNLGCAHKPGTVSILYLDTRIKNLFPDRYEEFRSMLGFLDHMKVYIDQSHRFFHGGDLNSEINAGYGEREPEVEEVILKCKIPEKWNKIFKRIKEKRDIQEYDDEFKQLLSALEDYVIGGYNQILEQLEHTSNP